MTQAVWIFEDSASQPLQLYILIVFLRIKSLANKIPSTECDPLGVL